MLPRYDPTQTYAWNYEHAPLAVAVDVPRVSGRWEFCGLPVDSPLGIAAGPLLNSRWLLYYASLGFDVLTYKTVRSRERECYPLPNLLPVRCGQLAGSENSLPASAEMQGSWAVSFGMPSKAPATWQADVALARGGLPPGKLLCVSVVGSVEPDWTLDRLADDYALCARWAAESGAQVVEANFSCPNVHTCDGQLYQQPLDAARVAERIRAAIGSVPVVVKIGHLPNDDTARALLAALAPTVDALAMTNSVATTVVDAAGQPLFDGQRRGICGTAIREASLAQTARLARLAAEMGLALRLVGVGGASTLDDVRRYLAAGAHAVHLATAAMLDPGVGLALRRAWNSAL